MFSSLAAPSSRAVKRFAQDVIAPKVREMDEKEVMDPEIIKGLFENGVRSSPTAWRGIGIADAQLMGIETSADHDGSECSFTSAIIAVEELAKVDPSVAVLVDVHNTLVNTVLRLYGSDEIKNKWLPDLATSKVSSKPWRLKPAQRRSVRSVCLNPTPVPTLSVSRLPRRKMETRTFSTEARRMCHFGRWRAQQR